MCKLPRGEYRRDQSDPAWLVYAAQFHGHLGPWATAGARLGMAGLRAAGAAGHFDVEVTCRGPLAKPPHSCFLDGLQVATGATLGKRNLHWVQSDQIVVRVRNTHAGKQVEVRPSDELLSLLTSFKPRPKAAHPQQAGDSHKHGRAEDPLAALARKIALMPDAEILSVTSVGEK